MSLARRPLLACAALLLLPAARSASAAEALIKGSGVATTQRREIGVFLAIGVGGPFAVVLRAGSREAIEIVADDNVLPLIETRVRDTGGRRTLQIDLPRNTRVEPRTAIVVTVDYVRLEELAVGGSASISAKSMKAAKLEAAIGGSGSIDLGELDAGDLVIAIGGSGSFRGTGRAAKMSVSVGGSGRCDAAGLVAGDVTASVAGSGDARVRAETTLRVSIAGSGDVYHSGAATPQVAIAGSGHVKGM